MNHSSTDEEYEEISSSTESEKDTGRFRIPGMLNAPAALTMTMKTMHHWIHHGVIELNPPWQRDVVWKDEKQSKLIVSIYQNYWIPPVVFVVEKVGFLSFFAIVNTDQFFARTMMETMFMSVLMESKYGSILIFVCFLIFF